MQPGQASVDGDCYPVVPASQAVTSFLVMGFFSVSKGSPLPEKKQKTSKRFARHVVKGSHLSFRIACEQSNKSTVLPIVFLIAFLFSATTSYGEESGLSGLGEPAAPESLLHPEQVMPNDVVKPSPAPAQLPAQKTPPPSNGPDNNLDAKSSTIFLQPKIEQNVILKPFTLRGAVEYSLKNYPNVLKSQSQVRVAKRNVTLQKINEYMPDSLFQYQELMASHNKLSQVFFGSPVFPAISGPATGSTTMEPYMFSAAG